MRSRDLAVADVMAWEALDSRGNPTVACRVTLTGGAIGRAVVPAGASTGRHEAREWRDGGMRMRGLGVRAAVGMIETHIRPALIGTDASQSALIDRVLRSIVPPPDRGFLGSNTTLAVSVAATRAGAAGLAVPLWRHIQDEAEPLLLPMPMVQILSGGVHAGGVIDLQDILVIPMGAQSFAEAIEMVWRVRARAAADADADGHNAALVGDEGGLAIRFRTNRAAVEFVARSIERAGLGGEVCISIDVAAGQLIDDAGRFRLTIEDRILDREAWIAELRSWVRNLPICSIEDPLDEDDWLGWRQARDELDVEQLIGDDLFVTDPDRLARGIRDGVATAVLVKPNQRGTLTEAAEVVQAAKAAGMRAIVSARSGETEDDWLADLAIGWGAGQIKVGSLTRSDRTAKWNRLLEIEALESDTRFARPFGA